MAPRILEGNLDASQLRFAIVVSRFNSMITDRLLAGALDALIRSNCKEESIEVVKVPGSWELPMAAAELARQKKHDGVICLGCLIRGETPHFDYIASGATKGLAQIAVETGVPVAFGVLTANTVEQAVNRAGIKNGNKGFDAAMTAIEMANLVRRLRGQSA